MKWNDEDIERVEKFIDIKNRGMYCDSNQLNEVYNRVLEKNATPTSCGSCMRHRISELETALKRHRQELEKVKSVTVEELNEEIKDKVVGIATETIIDTPTDTEITEPTVEEIKDNEETVTEETTQSVEETNEESTTEDKETTELTEKEKMKIKMAKVREARKNKKK